MTQLEFFLVFGEIARPQKVKASLRSYGLAGA